MRLAAGLLLCLIGAACGPRQAAPSLDVERELRAAAAEWDRAFNAADLAALVALYADDAISMPFNAPVSQGRAALEASFRTFFAENEAARHHTLLDEIQISPDFATERARYQLTFTSRQDRKPVVENGHHVMNRRKIGGRWLITWEIFNADTAPVVAPGSAANGSK